LVLILTAISYGAWAVELWNGFTTDMSKDDVIIRAKTTLDTKSMEESGPSSFNPFDNRANLSKNNNAFPSINLLLSFSGSSNQYRSIYFYFTNSKLFAVRIQFLNATIKDFLPLATNQYGKNYTELIETYKGVPGNTFAEPFQRRWYVWKLPDREIYVTGRQIKEIMMEPDRAWLFVCDKKAIDNLARERANAENQRREAATSGIQF